MTRPAPLPTIADAVRWVTDRWAFQRTVPLRLHVMQEEGVGLTHDRLGCDCLGCTSGADERGLGSHAFSRHFGQTLDGTVNAVWDAPTTVDCYHPTLRAGASPRDCAECLGSGIKESTADRFRFPMSRAISRLSERRPTAAHAIIALAMHGWDIPTTVAVLGLDDDRPIHAAIRALYSKYEEGPYSSRSTSSATSASGHVVAIHWTELSESQRNAMESTTSA